MGQVSKAFNHIVNSEKITELSVVLYADSFFYGLWSEDHQILRSDTHHISNFNKFLKIWNNNYQIEMVRVLSMIKPYLHLNSADFSEKHFSTYFKGIYDVRKKNDCATEVDKFLQEPINTLHYIEQNVIKSLNEYDFPFKISHISTALSNYALLNEEQFLIFIEADLIHISITKNGKFQFYNQFYCSSSNDYLYFIALILKAFDLDAHNENIQVGGLITMDSPLHTKLKAYLPNLNLIKESLMSSKPIEKPLQLYFDLYLCKSCV